MIIRTVPVHRLPVGQRKRKCWSPADSPAQVLLSYPEGQVTCHDNHLSDLTASSTWLLPNSLFYLRRGVTVVLSHDCSSLESRGVAETFLSVQHRRASHPHWAYCGNATLESGVPGGGWRSLMTVGFLLYCYCALSWTLTVIVNLHAHESIQVLLMSVSLSYQPCLKL